MSRNGSGTYSLPAGNPVVTGTTITTTWANTTLSDIASSLTGSVAADGQTPMSGSLNMANNKVSAVLDPTSAQDAATKTYVDTADTTNLALTLLKANNLSDVANATTARTNLGLGSIATQASSAVAITGGTITGITDLAVADGGTGASTATNARTNLGVAIGTDVLAYVAPSTSGNVLTSNGTTWASTAPIFSKSFVSSNQSIPTASSQTFSVAHSLGVVPKIVRVVAVCLTASLGWAVGAEGEVLVNGTSNGNIQTLGALADATNVYYGSGSSIVVFNYSTSDFANIVNNANFAIKIYAFA